MNEQQLKNAKTHFEELKYGMKNIDVKALGLRPFCQRKERKISKVRTILWALTPEWINYVDERLHPIEITNESKPFEDASDFSSLIQEISSVKVNDSPSDPLLVRMENSIVNGRCKLVNVFDRATLLFRYYERLTGEGMTDDELIDADLVDMLGQYLDYNSYKCIYTLHDPRKRLYLKYLIRKYYKKDIKEYRTFIIEIYNKIAFQWNTQRLLHVPKHLYGAIWRFFKNAKLDMTLDDYRELVSTLDERDSKIWNEEVMERRNRLIKSILVECHRSIKSYETRFKHPFEIEDKPLVCMIYIFVKEYEAGEKEGREKVSDDKYLLELMKSIDWEMVTSVLK